MFEEVKLFWQNAFNFKGRARRREYWVANLFCASINFVLSGLLYLLLIILMCMTNGEKTVFETFGSVFIVILLVIVALVELVYAIIYSIACISLCVRRCHDLGYNGYVYLFCIIGCLFCGIGSIVWLVLCCMDSKQEDNQWGLYPKSTLTNRYINNTSIITTVIVYVVTLVLYLSAYISYTFYFMPNAGMFSNISDSYVEQLDDLETYYDEDSYLEDTESDEEDIRVSSDEDDEVSISTDKDEVINKENSDEEDNEITSNSRESEKDTNLYDDEEDSSESDKDSTEFDDEEENQKGDSDSRKSDDTEESKDSSSDKETDGNRDTKKEKSTDFSGSSWESFEVSIDNTIITLPCTYADLQELGYSLSDSYIESLSETLESNMYTTSIKLEDTEGNTLSARFLNSSDEDKPLEECDIYGINFDSFYDLADIEVCGGLTMDMSYDDVIDLFGKPDYSYSGEEGTYESIEYYLVPDKSYYGGLKVSFYEGKMNRIELENMNY